jgi:Flp pilus assembly pilin Flp
MRWLIDFLSDDEGVAAVEYVVMLALIILVILTAVSQVGNVTRNVWLTVSSRLDERW